MLDTGVFNEDRYFDVFVEYAKAGAEDLGIRISVANRGPEAATLHLLPTLWFRNTWSWEEGAAKPVLEGAADGRRERNLGSSYWIRSPRNRSPTTASTARERLPLLFTENETNNARLFGGKNASAYVKDGINDFVVSGNARAVNPANQGTKASPHYILNIGPGETRVVRLRSGAGRSRRAGEPL